MKPFPFQFYRELTALRHIKRFVQHATVRPISVAEHSFNVAMLCWQFGHELLSIGCVVDPYRLSLHGLWHDVEEALTSDLPHQVKRMSPELQTVWVTVEQRAREALARIMAVPPSLDLGEQAIITLADGVELVLYVVEEQFAGNHCLNPAAEKILSNLDAQRDQPEFHRLSGRFRDWYVAKVEEVSQVYWLGPHPKHSPHRPLSFGQGL